MAVIIISIIAAFGFSNAARKKGFSSHRFWVYPLAVGFGVSTFCLVLSLFFAWITKNQDSILSKTHPFVIGLFSISLALSLISKAWKEIKELPNKQMAEIDKVSPSDDDEPEV
jgi:hypothetical protein